MLASASESEVEDFVFFVFPVAARHVAICFAAMVSPLPAASLISVCTVCVTLSEVPPPPIPRVYTPTHRVTPRRNPQKLSPPLSSHQNKMASIAALSGGVAALAFARCAGAGVSRQTAVAHAGAGNTGFSASALLGKGGRGNACERAPIARCFVAHLDFLHSGLILERKRATTLYPQDALSSTSHRVSAAGEGFSPPPSRSLFTLLTRTSPSLVNDGVCSACVLFPCLQAPAWCPLP